MDGPEETTRQPIKGHEGSTQGAVDGGTFFNMAINHVLKEANDVLEPGRDGIIEVFLNFKNVTVCITHRV